MHTDVRVWKVNGADLNTPRVSFNVRVNPLTPMSDQDRISPYYINTISTR